VLRVLAAIVVIVVIGLVTGCESDDGAPTPPATRAAPPQREELGWMERTPPTGPGLVFRVHWFEVTETGWKADVEIENRSGLPWELGADDVAVEQSFGIMLFATDGLEEVEQRSADGDLPALRAAQAFMPALVAELAPGEDWRGVISSPGSLAAGRYVRVVFGPLIALDEVPPGLPSRFVWITDHAYRLRGPGATVAQP
jgi:hypothetical protein